MQTINSISVHPSGNHFLIGDKSGNIAWFQLDLSEKPYKQLDFHKNPIQGLNYHPRHNLFASAANNGEILVYYSKVYDDLIHDPLIVPLNKLGKASKTELNDLVFHPIFPWIFSCGEDNKIHMWS